MVVNRDSNAHSRQQHVGLQHKVFQPYQEVIKKSELGGEIVSNLFHILLIREPIQASFSYLVSCNNIPLNDLNMCETRTRTVGVEGKKTNL